jgi:hypothetical protein
LVTALQNAPGQSGRYEANAEQAHDEMDGSGHVQHRFSLADKSCRLGFLLAVSAIWISNKRPIGESTEILFDARSASAL